MEVHHHPTVEKKTFKEYFLEFLMIFLAVTMGFFAENVREHFTEKAKGKEYIKSFVEDLSSDTAEYNIIIKELTDKDSILQNMDNCFDTLQKRMVFTKSLWAIIRNSTGFTDFIYTDRTIQQIKSAGGLQLIQNNEIENHILQYDAFVRADLIHQKSMEDIQAQTINAHISMVGYKQFESLITHNQVVNNSELLTTDKRELNTYFSTIMLFRISCRGQLARLKHLRTMAVELIDFLNKHKK